mmetsp:Transcript_44200/g.136434  ORF Transcript_44200/g.136434 Transcript_44200/m.136434 type:complete len:258 (+) Transcript_44200:1225-1998(+)
MMSVVASDTVFVCAMAPDSGRIWWQRTELETVWHVYSASSRNAAGNCLLTDVPSVVFHVTAPVATLTARSADELESPSYVTTYTVVASASVVTLTGTSPSSDTLVKAAAPSVVRKPYRWLSGSPSSSCDWSAAKMCEFVCVSTATTPDVHACQRLTPVLNAKALKHVSWVWKLEYSPGATAVRSAPPPDTAKGGRPVWPGNVGDVTAVAPLPELPSLALLSPATSAVSNCSSMSGTETTLSPSLYAVVVRSLPSIGS